MILNRREQQEEAFIRKIMMLIRMSGDKSIKDQSDVSRFVKEHFHNLGFEETRDIMLAWKRLQNNPYKFIVEEIAMEMLKFFREEL